MSVACCSRIGIVQDFYLGNVFLHAKLWFVGDVILSFALFIFALFIANLLYLPEVIWHLGIPFIDTWYCYTQTPQLTMFRNGSLLDLLFHVVYLIGSLVMLCGICIQNRWICGVYPVTTFVALVGFICVRVWVMSECRWISPLFWLGVKELWFAFGFWFCTVTHVHLDKSKKRKRMGMGVGDSSMGPVDFNPL